MRVIMSQNEIKTLIQSLIDSGKLTDNSVDDLNDFQKDIRDGKLKKSDEAYVKALATRLNIADKSKHKTKTKRGAKSARADTGGIDWQERAVIAEAKIEDLEIEIEDLKAKNAENNTLAPEKSPAKSIDEQELQVLLDQLYDEENDKLQEISNTDASAILKKIKSLISHERI